MTEKPSIGPMYDPALRTAAAKKDANALTVALMKHDENIRNDAYLVAADNVRTFARDKYPEHTEMLEQLAREIEQGITDPEAFGVAFEDEGEGDA